MCKVKDVNIIEEESNDYSVREDSYLKDRVDELDIKITGVLNHTQGKKYCTRSLVVNI